MLSKLSANDYVELICLITSIVCFRKIKQSVLVWFIPLLVLTIIVEWGSLFHYFIINGSNHWIYNILTAIEFVFFFYLFYRYLNKKTIKKIAFLAIPFFALAVLANWLFIQGLNHFHTNAYIAGSLLIIFFACSYFFQLLQSPQAMKLIAIPFFWISTGLLFFYAGQFVVMAIFPYMAYAKDKTFAQVFDTIVENLNILLYCCFIIAFLCQRKTINTYT